ncbi:MAG: histidine phosphatase family protein [Polyangiaceae bacterium]
MDLILVRHGESEANAEGRLQGSLDYPLSERGRAQARQLAAFLRAAGVTWHHAYASPLRRATETGEIVCSLSGAAPPTPELDLHEIRAGSLEGMTKSEIEAQRPEFAQRGVMDLGDFAEFGGEGYDSVQARIDALLGRLIQRHEPDDECAILFGHGGVNFQFLKRVICRPVPRICIVRMGNCSVTRVKLRERRGTFMGELVFHLPIEMMGEVGSVDTGALFR